MFDRLRVVAVALALAVGTIAVLTAGVAQLSAGDGCGVGLATACQTGGTP